MCDITYKITRGSAPFTAELNPGAVQQVHNAKGTFSFEDVAPGTYSLTVTDARGCPYTVENIECG